VKTVRPGRLDTSTRPWCASTTAQTMASPSPVLPPARDLEVSPRVNRSKISGWSSVGIPGPLSVTVSSTVPFTGASSVTTVVPGGV
jgi:hypothetical protein